MIDYLMALHLRAEGDHVVLSIEHNGKWIQLIKERLDSPFSHIIEPAGIIKEIEKPPTNEHR